MNLRVFRSAESVLMVEISSPSLESELKWFVPLVERDSEKLQNVNPREQIHLEFQGKPYSVLFMLIRTIRIEENREGIVGQLTLEDSINVLNNIFDRLAYDVAER